MNFFIVEIKALYQNHDWLRALLKERAARLVGTDHQTDTYFKVPEGRLKLREGNIENSLIYYNRGNQAAPKVSDGKLVRMDPESAMKELLTTALGVLVEVVKERQIYFIDNVKIHLDRVNGLGTFVEIEAIDPDGSRGEELLRKQCQELMHDFRIREEDLIDRSYSDLLLEKQRLES